MPSRSTNCREKIPKSTFSPLSLERVNVLIGWICLSPLCCLFAPWGSACCAALASGERSAPRIAATGPCTNPPPSLRGRGRDHEGETLQHRLEPGQQPP